jgi:H+/Cl- antiporter ClcA
VIGLVYLYLGGRSIRGNALLLEQIHEPTAWLPRRMAPLILGGTLWAHLFGASVGREGTALQMSGGLSDTAARLFRIEGLDRRVLLVSSLAGGLGGVFGVPFAGAIFALEVQPIGTLRWRALIPSAAAAFVGNAIVRGLGYHHSEFAALSPHVEGALVARYAIGGVLFGVAAGAFVWLVETLKHRSGRWIPWLPWRAAVGGVLAMALILVAGREYSGLSVPLSTSALAGAHVASYAFAVKLLATALCLGFGFVGGEVTPLFVIGATLGNALAAPLNLPVRALAAVGFVSVFGGAARTPIACTVMAVELFGRGIALPALVGCAAATAVIALFGRGLYD